MTRMRTFLGNSALAPPVLTVMGVFFLLPMMMMFAQAFLPFDSRTLTGTTLTLENFGRFLGDPVHLATFWRTFIVSLMTALLAMAAGYPLAWHLHSLRSGQARLWCTLIVLMPLMISLIVASFAWMLLLGNNGAFNNALRWIGVIDRPIRLMNTVTGVVIVSAYSTVSYPILTTFAALENIPPELARSARIHGASERQIFARVILPLSLPELLAGGLITFSLTMAAFVVPFMIGGGRVNVVPLMIYQHTLQLFDWPGAAALGILLFLLTLAFVWFVTRLAQLFMPWERR
ncbi:ABC transporter permease [Mesobacterium pallidum]|uniref:ABC transporter permease n=1 Tax=Mesobacterium pallidum TaxID=2872037 RepID=UPI001EE21ADD|nr:ABC transporter permease [Mesobacterium pallidum]